jgi:hypothetical protein
MPPSPHTHLSWVLRQLRRLILQSPVLRGSARALLFLWSLLRRYCSSWLHIPPPPPPPSLSSSSTIPITKSIDYDLPYTNNTPLNRDAICASTAPAPAPPTLTISASSSGSPARLSSTASRELAVPCHDDNPTPSGCQSPILDHAPFTAEPEPIRLEEDIADIPPSNYLNDPAGGPDSNPTPPLETSPRPIRGNWTLTPVMPDAVQDNRYENYHIMFVCLRFVLDSDAHSIRRLYPI